MYTDFTESEQQTQLAGVDIPPCPAILMDLDRELRKDQPCNKTMAHLISQDVALSGHLIKVVNSPAINCGQEITSINKAITLLGSQQIFNLITTQLIKRAFATPNGISLERFWESSALTAQVCAELAKQTRCIRSDIAYTFGLFHDCGIPLLALRFPNTKDVLKLANQSEDLSFTEIENLHLKTNHAVVGYYLAKRWRLSDDIAQAIRTHHNFALFKDPGQLSSNTLTLIALSTLAEHIVRLHTGDQNVFEWPKVSGLACSRLGISLGSVDDLIHDMLEWLG